MLDTKEIFHCIGPELSALEEKLYEAVASPVTIIGEMGRHLVKSGGKRLRPALFLLAARAYGETDRERTMPLAAAIELIHMASLVHDDVIDTAGTRRGNPTLNAKWGNQAAVLTGDFMFAQAFSLVLGKGYEEAVGERLASLVRGLCAGEILQDAALYRVPPSIEDYERRISMKTADFFAVCTELGAMIGGASERAAASAKAYGKALGMAFQITDDILDVAGRAERTGKPAGNDIRQGVVTLPALRGLEVSPDREELGRILTNPRMTDEDVRRAIEIVRASDGVDFARQAALRYVDEARRNIPEDMEHEAREAFFAAADNTVGREF